MAINWEAVGTIGTGLMAVFTAGGWWWSVRWKNREHDRQITALWKKFDRLSKRERAHHKQTILAIAAITKHPDMEKVLGLLMQEPIKDPDENGDSHLLQAIADGATKDEDGQ